MISSEKISNLELKKTIFFGSVFLISTCIFSLLIINFFRIGLFMPLKLNFLIILLTFSLATCPFLVNIDDPNLRLGNFFTKVSLIILTFFLLPLLGFASSSLYFFIVTISIFFALYKIKSFALRVPFLSIFIIILFSIFFSIINIPDKIEYFFSPEITSFGYGGNQTMQGAAITNIIKNYGIVSMGIDGLESFQYKYHWGVYLWWAAIGKISLSDGLYLVPFTRVAVLTPMIFYSLFIFTLSFLQNFSKSFLLFQITFFLVVFFDLMGGRLHYDSETYGASIIVLLLILPSFLFFLKKKDYSKLDYLFIYFLIASIVPISGFKLTTGLIVCILVFLIIFYKINYKNIFISIFFFISLLASGIMSYLLFMPSSYTSLSPMLLYFSTTQMFASSTFFMLLLPILFLGNFFFKADSHKTKNFNYLVFKKRLQKNNYLKKIIRWIIQKNITWPKACFIVSIGSILPLFVMPVGSTAISNLVQLHWLFFPLLFLFILKNAEFLTNLKFLFIPSVFLILISASMLKPSTLNKEQLRNFFKEISKDGSKKITNSIKQNIKNNDFLFNSFETKKIKENTLNLILSDAKKYSLAYKRNFAIYVPKSNSDFWNIMKEKSPYWCSSASFIIPSLSGIQMLKGVQDPKDCSIYVAGPSEYKASSFTQDLSNSNICKYSKLKNINKIYRLNDIKNKKNNFLLDCDNI